MTDNIIHDRLMSAAREHAASTGASFRVSLDHVAAQNGYRDWAEQEDLSRRTSALDRFDYHAIFMFGPSRPIDRPDGRVLKGYVERIAIAAFSPVADAIGADARVLRVSSALTIAALASTMLAFAMSTIDMATRLGDLAMAGPALLSCMSLLLGWMGTVRTTAARSDPHHRGTPILLSLPLFWAFWTLPLAGIILLSPLIDPDQPRPGEWMTLGTWAIAVSSPLWTMAMGLVLALRKEPARG